VGDVSIERGTEYIVRSYRAFPKQALHNALDQIFKTKEKGGLICIRALFSKNRKKPILVFLKNNGLTRMASRTD
jgi:hypothetical protein